MRSAVAIAAFAAGALAVPYGHRQQERELKTDWDIVIKTDIVTVTAHQPAAPTSVAAPATTAVETTTSVAPLPTSTHVAVSEHQNWSGHQQQQHPEPQVQSSPSVVIVTIEPSSIVAPAPAPTTVASSASSQVQAEVNSAPAPVEVPASSAAEAIPAAPSSAGSTYQDTVVYHHNLHRANHSAPNIEWSDNLALSAQLISMNCDFAHNNSVMGGGYGQNIAAGVGPNNISSIITDMFYNGEVNYYDGLYGQAQPSMDLFENWGHFSQVVWKGTTQVGCATQYCPNGLANTGSDVDAYFTVCNYGPEGNMANEYGDNIGSPLGMPTASWDAGL